MANGEAQSAAVVTKKRRWFVVWAECPDCQDGTRIRAHPLRIIMRDTTYLSATGPLPARCRQCAAKHTALVKTAWRRRRPAGALARAWRERR